MDLANNFSSFRAGSFDLQTANLSIDYRSTLGDSLYQKTLLLHEKTHELISLGTEFGLATVAICERENYISLLIITEYRKLIELLVEEQRLAQEALAIFTEAQYLVKRLGRDAAIKHYEETLSEEYLNYFNIVKGILFFPDKYRKAFLDKAIKVVFNSSIRILIVKESLFSNFKYFGEYVKSRAVSPNIRLTEFVNAVQKNKKILKLDNRTIYARLGYEYIQTSPSDIVSFINHLNTLLERPYEIAESDIRTSGVDFSSVDSLKKVYITNINSKIAENAIILENREDLLHYADIVDALFITPPPEINLDVLRFLESKWGRSIETSFCLYAKDNSKYLYSTNNIEASGLISDVFGHSMLLCKYGMVNEQRSVRDLQVSIRPDLVIFNNVNEIIDFTQKTNAKYSYAIIGVSKEHLTETLLLIDEMDIMYVCNAFKVTFIDLFERLGSNFIEAEWTTFAHKKRQINFYYSTFLGVESQDFYEEIAKYNESTDKV